MMRFDRAHYDRKLAALHAQREKDVAAVQDAEERVTAATQYSAMSVYCAEQNHTSAQGFEKSDAETVANAELAVRHAEGVLDSARRTLHMAWDNLAESSRRVKHTQDTLDRARAVNAEAAGPHQAYLDEARRRLEKLDRRIANHVATAPREAPAVDPGETLLSVAGVPS